MILLHRGFFILLKGNSKVASPIEEGFVMDNLSGESVFEFGCAPGLFTENLVNMGYNVTGIDLYSVPHRTGYDFIMGDLVDLIKLADPRVTQIKYDNVICVSSFEHCGVETKEFAEGKINIVYHLHVAEVLAGIVKENGRLIITTPFGSPEIFLVDGDGNNGRYDKIQNPVWGFRTFDLETLTNLFDGLQLIKSTAFAQMDINYFDSNSWKEVSCYDHSKYDNKNRAIICCVFENRRQ